LVLAANPEDGGGKYHNLQNQPTTMPLIDLFEEKLPAIFHLSQKKISLK
jgi:hypothetical protein